MTGLKRNRQEDDRAFTVTREIIEISTPQDKDRCSMANAARCDLQEDISMSYDLTTGDVIAVWQQREADRIRLYSGNVEPNKLAMQILMGTDLDKDRLTRLCPDEGWSLTITRCESRFQQTWQGRDAEARKNRTETRGTSTHRKPRRMYARAARV